MTLKEEFYETHLKRWVKREFTDLTKIQLNAIDQLEAYQLFVKKRENFQTGLVDAVAKVTNPKA